MSIRERIMAIQPIFADDAPEFHYGCFYRGCELSADLAEARERELLAQRDELLAAGQRVTRAFRALGVSRRFSDELEARAECERAMVALDAAIAKIEGRLCRQEEPRVMNKDLIRQFMVGAIVDVDVVHGGNSDELNEELARMYIPNVFAERFAELIVQEAIKVVQGGVVRNGATPENERTYSHVKDLKEHFGVEE